MELKINRIVILNTGNVSFVLGFIWRPAISEKQGHNIKNTKSLSIDRA